MTIIQIRRDTAANWTTVNPILTSGEPGYERDTGKRKTGNGTSAWVSLAYETDAISAAIVNETSRATTAEQAISGAYVPRLGADSTPTKRASALQSFHAALAGANYAPCNIVSAGDSRCEGVAQTIFGRRYIDRFATLLRSRLSITPGALTNFIPPDLTGGTVHVGSVTGSFSNANLGYGLGKRARQASNAAGTITWTFTGTSYKVMGAVNNTTGSYTLTVDGGAAVTVNTATGSATVTDGVQYTSPALTAGTHTVVLTWVSAYVFIDGIQIFNGDEAAGLRVFDGAHSGFTSNDYASNVASQQWPQAYAAVNPHLLVIELGTNDLANNVPLSTYQSNLTLLISTIRTACANTTLPVCLVAGGQRTGAYTNTWAQFVAVMAAVEAGDANVVMFDGSARFPTGAGDTIGFYFDGLHETDKGHAMHASGLAQFLAPA